MTTKEFIKRSNVFSQLSSCPYLFDNLVFSCFKVTLLTDNSSFIQFCTDVSTPVNILFGESIIESVRYVYYEYYSYEQFRIDIGFFKFFYSRLSEYQKCSLLVSHKVDNLLKYCKCNNMLNY